MDVVLQLPVVQNVELVAAKAVEAVGGALGMPQAKVEAASVATVEACLNAMEHGGGGVVVRLDRQVGNGRLSLVVEVEDHGAGFDPTCVTSERTARPRGCVVKRGWGLTLIHELMDEVEIQSRPGLTLVRMVKYVENGG